jgi:hypothetical protein
MDEEAKAEVFSPLKRSFEWRNLFEQAEDSIKHNDFASAIATLRQALPIAEEIGVEWMGYVETLERLGYSLYELATQSNDKPEQRRQQLEEAEEQLKCSLNMLARVENVFEDVDQVIVVRTIILTHLQKVLTTRGKTAEAEKAGADLAALPAVIDTNEDPIETTFLTTISNMLYTLEAADDTANATTVENILERLVEQIRSVYGPNSQQAAEAMQRLGLRAQTTRDNDKAEKCFNEALRIRLNLLGRNHASIAKSLRDLGNFYRSESIGKGFMERARKIEKELGIVNPFDASIKILSTASGIPPEMRDKLLLTSGDGQHQNVLDSRVDEYFDGLESKPPISSTENLVSEQRFKRLISMLQDARSIVEQLEENEEYPLSTVCVLSALGRSHKMLGDGDEAKKLKKERLAIIAKHWGEDHAMIKEEQEED